MLVSRFCGFLWTYPFERNNRKRCNFSLSCIYFWHLHRLTNILPKPNEELSVVLGARINHIPRLEVEMQLFLSIISKRIA